MYMVNPSTSGVLGQVMLGLIMMVSVSLALIKGDVGLYKANLLEVSAPRGLVSSALLRRIID